MSHHHDDHHHDHHHHHAHVDTAHGDAEPMSTPEKLAKLLDHWAHHNEEHARTYRLWADRAREAGLTGVAERLERAAAQNLAINTEFAAALKDLDG